MKLSLLAFAILEYDRRGWDMPDVHTRIYDWFERTDSCRVRVLRVFRGCGKSTILGVRNSKKLMDNPEYQLLIQGADDDLAEDISRDTIAIMAANDLTQGLIKEPAGVTKWWTHAGFEANARTPQMRAKGILSRTTGNRADEIQSDDCEVEKNVSDPEARKKLRKKLSEQTFILKPDGSKLFVGTPHAHDSLYDELIAAGAEHLTIPMYEHQERYEDDMDQRVRLPIGAEPGEDGVWVFSGIWKSAKLLKEGVDYDIDGRSVVLRKPSGGVVDVCTGSAWPERFHRKEMESRRQECRTLNEWDSQFQLHAKPIGEVRLNPDNLREYNVEPVVQRSNGEIRMMLGQKQIMSARSYWDVSLGKVNGDASALSVILEDDSGNYYWQHAEGFTGEFAKFEDDENGKIVSGQVMQACAIIRKFQLPLVYVEDNGVGSFVPQLLRKALKQERLQCAVRAVKQTTNKNVRILNGIEGPLRSGVLWAHTSVLDGPAYDEMKEWVPDVTKQPDDYIESCADALLEAPVRIGKIVGEMGRIATERVTHDWRPNGGVFEVTLETQS